MNEIKSIKTVGDLKKVLASYPDNAQVYTALDLEWRRIEGVISVVEGYKYNGYALTPATHDAKTVRIQILWNAIRSKRS